MIEVFKTNVQYKLTAKEIGEELSMRLPDSKVSFDLEDCDRILRIESNIVNPHLVISMLRKRGYNCEILE